MPFLSALRDAFGIISNTGEIFEDFTEEDTASIYRSLVRCNSPSVAVVEELRTIRVPGNFPKIMNGNCGMWVEKENPDIFTAFNRVVSDVRINIPASEDPPFDLHVTLLIRSDGLSVEELNAIDVFKVAIHSSLDTDLVHLDPDDPRILTEEEMSLKEFYATRPIYLGDYTYRGEEIEGARPPERN